MTKQIFKFNKLVRDKIPQMIEAKGCRVHQNNLEGNDFVAALKSKLIEEANEVASTKSLAELKEELADIMEVILSIASASKIDLNEIEEIREKKNIERGGFAQGIFVSHIEIDEDNPAIEYYKKRSTKYLEALNHDHEFWLQLTKLFTESEIVIERPKNTAHPRYPNFIYPVDYGFLKGTKSSDGNEIDIWVGTSDQKEINGILCTVDPMKKDIETKIVYACTMQEIRLICDKMNEVLRAIYIPKPEVNGHV